MQFLPQTLHLGLRTDAVPGVLLKILQDGQHLTKKRKGKKGSGSFDKHRNLNSVLALHGLPRKYSPLICREPPSSSSRVICMYYKLQCWLAIFRQLPHTAQHPCASLSIPVLLQVVGPAWVHKGYPREDAPVTQAKGSISPGKTQVSPHPSSHLDVFPSNA